MLPVVHCRIATNGEHATRSRAQRMSNWEQRSTARRRVRGALAVALQRPRDQNHHVHVAYRRRDVALIAYDVDEHKVSLLFISAKDC